MYCFNLKPIITRVYLKKKARIIDIDILFKKKEELLKRTIFSVLKHI